MNISQAKQIDLATFLEDQGIHPKVIRGNYLWYLSPIHEEKEPSFKLNKSTNEWYDYSRREGGDIIDLCKYLYNVTTVSDALLLIEKQVPAIINRQKQHKDIDTTNSESAEMRHIKYVSLKHNALLSYLTKRKIDLNIARMYCCEIHYVIRKSHYFAIAFRNRNGGYEVRNQYFKGCVGCKDISYLRMDNVEVQKHCIIFEGFMNFLSYMTIQAEGNSDILQEPFSDYIILNTVANINKAIIELQNYEIIHCFLDNDTAGEKALEAIKNSVNGKVTNESVRFRDFNDLNDYLINKLQI